MSARSAAARLGYFTAFASFGTPFICIPSLAAAARQSGPINYWLKILFNQTSPVINIYSLLGMILIESLLWSPFVFLMLAAAFRSMDPSLEEASSVCGARLWQTLRRVSLRLMLPAFFSVLLLIFIRTFESFEIPALVGLPATFESDDSIYLDAQKTAAPLRQRRRLCRAAYLVSRAALSLLPHHPRGRTLSHRDRQRLPARADHLGRWRYVAASAW